MPLATKKTKAYYHGTLVSVLAHETSTGPRKVNSEWTLDRVSLIVNILFQFCQRPCIYHRIGKSHQKIEFGTLCEMGPTTCAPSPRYPSMMDLQSPRG